MFRKYLYLLPFILFFSCNSSDKDGSKTNEKDSLNLKLEDQSWHVELSDKLLKDSFALPSSFVTDNVHPIEMEKEGSWEINSFLKIDSLKKNKTYDQYVDSLDIGQTKDATAWVYDTLIFESNKALVWGINYSSYEADPYYEGRSIFVTILSSANKSLNTKKILEISTSADPPGYSYTNGICIIEFSGNIVCNDSVVSGGDTETENDKDYEITEINLISRKYKIGPAGEIKEMENVRISSRKLRQPEEQEE